VSRVVDSPGKSRVAVHTRPSAPVLGSPSRTKSMSAILADEAPLDMYVDLSATDSQTSAIPSSPLSPRRRARLEILKEEQPSNKRRSASPENTPAPAPAGPAFTATGTRLVENLDTSASYLLSSDSIEDIHPLTYVQEDVQHQLSPRLFSRTPQPRQVVIRLPFASSPEAQLTRILHSQSQRAATDSTSPQVSTLKRAQSDASVMHKRTKYHFRHQRGTITPKVLDRLNAPEVVRRSRALPGFALVDFIIPRPRIERVSTIVS
jgi:hypothetical protein